MSTAHGAMRGRAFKTDLTVLIVDPHRTKAHTQRRNGGRSVAVTW